MKKIVLFAAFLASFSSAYSQYKYPAKEHAAIVKKSTLAVQLLDEKTEADKVKNKEIKDVFGEQWNASNVTFHTRSEIEEMKSSQKEGYAYLICKDDIQLDKSVSGGNPQKVVASTGTPKYTRTSASLTQSYFEYSLELIKNKENVLVTSIGFADNELSKIDYLFLCQQLSQLIESSAKGVAYKDFYNVNSNIASIKKSKLILLKDYFAASEIKTMPEFYQYDFEVVDKEKYKDIILSKKEDYNYVKVIWSVQNESWMWAVVDAKNGSIKALNNGVKVHNHQKASYTIRAKYVKNIVDKTSQKSTVKVTNKT